ncbi:M15 family metallopeptidase [Chondromyces apiculatus]|uniref:Putative peptidoglycan binding domain 1 n=1 Tax=Chondromyces apiculatus DSM 436 TaxID=1192034 RepID=A0A017T811_9BACT|nr:M15 family metallopeptidase [Chondromyces apiculatus]EYF04945.1 Putative peptidoglycan binding domain 1 [Chondromyces apiculatus DSM 436]
MSQAVTCLLRRLAVLSLLVAAPVAAAGCVASTEESDEVGQGEEVTSDEPEATESQTDAVTGTTVLQAADSSCSTTSVNGLSQQIIAEARCLTPDAYTTIPSRPNLTLGSAAYAYLEKPARDKLVAALDANPSTQMTINSMLRTVAQQYLLYRWYQSSRCSISLAATPGNSNHETGLALDVSQYSTWKTALTSRGFTWLGSSDPVHFDYTGTGAVSYKGLDVKAFQRLWNRNNPSDTIATDGLWGPQTETRMKKSPAAGFAIGATCVAAREVPGGQGVDLPDVDLPDVDLPDTTSDVDLPDTTSEAHSATLIKQLRQASEPEICGDHAH